MAFIPLRVLKTKPCSGPDAPAGNTVGIDLRLLAPALEPFLLLRARFCNYPGAPYSIQFAREGGGDFHYLNLEHVADQPQDAPIEVVAVGELPLTSDCAWRVLKLSQGGAGEEIARIHYEPYGLWRLRMADGQDAAPAAAQTPRQMMLIGGAPKSGTTWVERILNSHPDALATGENQFFQWPRRGPLYDLLAQTSPPYFAAAVRQQPPYWSQAAMFYAGRAERVLGQIGTLANVELAADKSPAYGRFLPEILESLPTWKYVHCVRHPLDVAVSRFFHERALLQDSPELTFLPRDRTLRMRVLAYDKNAAKPGEMFADLRLFDAILDASIEGGVVFDLAPHYDRIRIIAYEDLLSDPAHQMRQLLEFCGLRADDELLAEIAKRNTFEAFSGGRKQGEESQREFFRKGVAGDHLNHMTEEQIDYAKRRILAQCAWYKRYFD